MAAFVTKRERVLRTIRSLEVDRAPAFDMVSNEALIELVAGEPLTVENGDRIKGIAIGRTLDLTCQPHGPKRPSLVRQPNGLVVQQEPWTEWVEYRPFSDIPSTVEWIKKEIESTRAHSYNQAYAETMRAEVQRHLAYFAEGDPNQQNDPTVLALYSGVGLKEMVWMVGQDKFMRLMDNHEALLEEWLEARNQRELARVAALADPRLTPVVVIYDDIGADIGIRYTPEWLRSLWLPRLKRLVDAWRQRETATLFRANGSIAPFLTDLVSSGIDGLHLSDVGDGLTLLEVRRRYPNLFLSGGINSRQLLSYGLIDEVREVCLSALRATNGVGYFMGSTHGLNWEARPENALAMFETAKPVNRQIPKRRF